MMCFSSAMQAFNFLHGCSNSSKQQIANRQLQFDLHCTLEAYGKDTKLCGHLLVLELLELEQTLESFK